MSKSANYCHYNYHFINLGSVIQYVKDYKLILNSLIDTTPEYIFFTAQTFYEKRMNKKEKIIDIEYEEIDKDKKK